MWEKGTLKSLSPLAESMLTAALIHPRSAVEAFDAHMVCGSLGRRVVKDYSNEVYHILTVFFNVGSKSSWQELK